MTRLTAAEEAALNLSPRAKLEILFAILLAMFLFALDQTVVGTALPRDRHRPPGQQPLHVGDHDLPADLDDQRPDLRQAVGPVRAAPDRHLRGEPVPHQLGAVRPQPADVAVHPVPRPPGPRRRRRLPDRARGGRGPLHAGRAGQVPRVLRGGVRAFVARRPGPRRVHHRHLHAGTGSSSSTSRSASWRWSSCSACCRRSGGPKRLATSTTSARSCSRWPSRRSSWASRTREGPIWRTAHSSPMAGRSRPSAGSS